MWVVLGAIFVGAVQDFGALAVSIRARACPIGKVTESLIGPRAKTLFHILIFFLITLAMGVFVHIVATLFSPDFYPHLLLYLGVAAMYAGFFLTNPSFVAPAFDPYPAGAPPMFPFAFIVIACGAASGFHALVSSGTSAKQLDRESDARLVGYGAMLGESLLGLIVAVLACTAGFVSREAWLARYENWQPPDTLAGNIAAFITGTTHFLSAIGFSPGLAAAAVTVLMVSFALTSIDSATRLLRYNVAEVGGTLGVELLQNKYVASAIAVAASGSSRSSRWRASSPGLVLWQLFGTTNQVLAALALLAITVYCPQRTAD
ncbi:Peptide transporter CstA [Geodia barretti]|uniref:Peptide transporter CstA n=1 Tax=Geodia barretti TaxID=519541 RepID=A0AA35XLQ8_GEOBA|nr:Peptide transporter CstA [Geodia barretti]